MSESKNTIEVRVERTIPASSAEVFDGWLDPKVPGNPWNKADKLILDPQVDGMFYWNFSGTPHFGRFTEVQRPAKISHTWMSPNTAGLESTVVITFQQKEQGTLMTLVHSGLPDSDAGRSHEKGWNYFLSAFPEQFAKK